MRLTDKIKKILKVKKWRQKRLAEELGVSAQRLNHWLQKGTFPDEQWIIDKIDSLYYECIRSML